MDPKSQSSFIPKPAPSSLGTGLYTRRSNSGATVFGLLALLIFVICMVAALGVFGYERYLISRIGSMGTDLETAKNNLDRNRINEIVSIDKRIKGTTEILAHHTVLTPFFAFLENATLQNVSFSDFQYTNDGMKISIKMSGLARGYQAVALQADNFNKATYLNQPTLINPVFSDLHLDNKGNVAFDFSADLNAALISYSNYVTTTAPAPTTTTTSTSTTATTTKTTTKPATQ